MRLRRSARCAAVLGERDDGRRLDLAGRHGDAPSARRRGRKSRSDDRRGTAWASPGPRPSPSPAPGARPASGHSDATWLVLFFSAACAAGLPTFTADVEVLGARAPDAAMAAAALDHRDAASWGSGAASRRPSAPMFWARAWQARCRLMPPSTGARPSASPASWRCRRRTRDRSKVACDSRSIAGPRAGSAAIRTSASGRRTASARRCRSPCRPTAASAAETCARRGGDRFEVAQLELGHAAAGRMDDLGLDAVLGQHAAAPPCRWRCSWKFTKQVA